MPNSAIKNQPIRPASLESGGIWHFFSNPVVGFIGSIASVIGLGLAIYFYLESRATRELHYLVNPARAVVVHAGQTSRLAVTLDGASVKNDVSAAQIAFWNEGRASIRPDNMLRQLVIRTAPNIPIIEATLRKRSRDVVRIGLDRSRLASGELTLNWNILEYRDGGVIQIIYLGGVNAPVTATATVEGQGNMPEINAERPLFRTMAPLIILMITSMFSKILQKKSERLSIMLTALSFLLFLWIFIDRYLMYSETGPPFGF